MWLHWLVIAAIVIALSWAVMILLAASSLFTVVQRVRHVHRSAEDAPR